MAATFTRGAQSVNSILVKESRPTVRRYCTKGGSCADTLRDPKKLEAEEVKKKKSIDGNHDGSCCWMPHERTGIYYPKGQEKVMADVPASAGKDTRIHWFTYD